MMIRYAITSATNPSVRYFVPADLCVYVLDHDLGEQPHIRVSHPAPEVRLGKLIGNLSHHQLKQQMDSSSQATSAINHKWVKVKSLIKLQNFLPFYLNFNILFALAGCCLSQYLEDN